MTLESSLQKIVKKKEDHLTQLKRQIVSLELKAQGIELKKKRKLPLQLVRELKDREFSIREKIDEAKKSSAVSSDFMTKIETDFNDLQISIDTVTDRLKSE